MIYEYVYIYICSSVTTIYIFHNWLISAFTTGTVRQKRPKWRQSTSWTSWQSTRLDFCGIPWLKLALLSKM